MVIGLAEIVAIVSLFLGIVLLFSWKVEIYSTRKVLTGTEIVYIFLIAGVFKHMIDFQDIPEVVPPITSVIINLLLTVWSFYVALVKKNFSD